MEENEVNIGQESVDELVKRNRLKYDQNVHSFIVNHTS
jgi:hypothetical protein